MKERNRKLKKEYAIFDDSVEAEDKYKVTTPAKFVFDTRTQAKKYAKKNKLKDYKIFVVYGYSPGTKGGKK